MQQNNTMHFLVTLNWESVPKWQVIIILLEETSNNGMI